MKHYQLYRILRIWTKDSGHSWNPNSKKHLISFTDVINNKEHTHHWYLYVGVPTVNCSRCGYLVSVSNGFIHSESADGSCFYRSKHPISQGMIRKYCQSITTCSLEIARQVHKS